MKTVYCNGSVYTGSLPLAEAFGVEDGSFFFVGTNAEARAQHADALVDLQAKNVTVTGEADVADLKQAIIDAGYEVVE